MNRTAFPDPICLVANGELPDHPAVLELLRSAGTLLAVDGGADHLREMGLVPDVLLGDLDSVKSPPPGIQVVELPDPNATDLEKALCWCEQQGIPSLHLLGIFGKREDHALANHLLLIRYSHRIRLQAYSHRFLIEPLSGSHRRHSRPGQLISCLDPEGKALLTTRGLEYELKGESLGSPSRGVSNRARETSFQITVDGPPILLFQEL